MNASTDTACLSCLEPTLSDQGRIYHDSPTLVAGVVADLGGNDYHLLRCATCGTMQKGPLPPMDELMRCYEAAPPDNWGHEVNTESRQVPLFASLLRERQPAGGRLLDIGCANGAIAVAIKGPWQKFGVEPSKQAAALAEQRGVSIVAGSVDELAGTTRYNAIMALDLIEHITKPLAFLTKMRSLLAEGGSLLVLTGDTDAKSWRVFGAHHWYCSLPEHVVFFNERSMAWLAERSSFAVDGVVRIPHQRLPFPQRLNQFVRVLLWRSARKLGGLGIPRLRRWAMEHRSPYWSASTDHMVVTLRAV